MTVTDKLTKMTTLILGQQTNGPTRSSRLTTADGELLLESLPTVAKSFGQIFGLHCMDF